MSDKSQHHSKPWFPNCKIQNKKSPICQNRRFILQIVDAAINLESSTIVTYIGSDPIIMLRLPTTQSIRSAKKDQMRFIVGF
ncbi:hypothetical protein AAKU67_000959 [Oxalobacteraceae bacterium GrIS 2.11]